MSSLLEISPETRSTLHTGGSVLQPQSLLTQRQTPHPQAGSGNFFTMMARGLIGSFTQPARVAGMTGRTLSDFALMTPRGQAASNFIGRAAKAIGVTPTGAQAFARGFYGQTGSKFNPLAYGDDFGGGSTATIESMKGWTGRQVAGQFMETAFNLTAPFIGVGIGAKGVRAGVLTNRAARLSIAARRAAIQGGRIAGVGAAEGALFSAASLLQRDMAIEENLQDILIGAGLGVGLGLGVGAVGRIGGAGARTVQRVGGEVIGRVTDTELARIGRRAMTETFSVKERLRRLGAGGVVDLFENLDRQVDIRSGRLIVRMQDAGLETLTRRERAQLLDVAEGRMFASELTPKVLQVYNAFRRTTEEFAEEASQLGRIVKVGRGELREFRRRENYFPHVFPSVQTLKRPQSRVRQEVLEDTVRRGEFSNVQAAAKALDSFIERAESGKGGEFFVDWLMQTGQVRTRAEARGLMDRTFKKGRFKVAASLERARQFNNPFYDPDPARVLPSYIQQQVESLEMLRATGVVNQKGVLRKGAEVDKILGKLGSKTGKDARAEAQQLVRVVRGAIEEAHGVDEVMAFMRRTQIPKLAFAQILNLGQPLNVLLKSKSPMALASGVARAFTGDGKRFALLSGATTEAALKSARRKFSAEDTYADLFLHYTGFNLSERFNRRVASNAGATYVSRMFKEAQKTTGRKRTRAIEILREFGVDTDTAFQRGGLSEDDLFMAGNIMSEMTNFRSRPMDLPAFMSTSYGKTIFQFKSFSFQQAKLIKDTLKTDWKRGDGKAVLADLIILGIVFPMGGEVINEIRSTILGTERPTSFLDRYLQNFLTLGGLGLWLDLAVAARQGFLLEAVTGPVVGSGVQLSELTARGDLLEDRGIKWMLRQTGFGGAVANRMD